MNLDLNPNSLYYGDCLEILKKWKKPCIDLCYLDPPFNSQTNYNILFGQEEKNGVKPIQLAVFEDTWHWGEKAQKRLDVLKKAHGYPESKAIISLHSLLGDCGMMAYLSYMVLRLAEIRRVLKPNGSVYLHCDPTVSHYLKIIMDAVFGANNFRNEIVWSYQRWTGGTKHFQRMHDTILFYAKSNKDCVFNALTEPYSQKSQHKGRRHSKFTKAGKIEQKYTSDTTRQKSMRDVWDISYLNSQAKERLGYRTQKPLALLERIIQASSNKGDIVLDPFCGCGTTVDAANRLDRRWIGIDISPYDHGTGNGQE